MRVDWSSYVAFFHALTRDVNINPSIELNLNLIFWWRESYATQLLT